MPNINDAFPSKFLKASDLRGVEPVVAIERVELEPVGRDRQMKLVAYFAGKEKGLVLNKTNANTIMSLAGSPETDDWQGMRLRLYTAEANFGGETFECIRIKAAGKPKTATSKPLPPPPSDDGPVDDDEIGF